jgi:hypothetical protein
MKKQITRISVVQSAKVAAALYFVITIPFMVIMALIMAVIPGRGMGMGIGMMIMLPILYAIFGFLFSLLGGWIYNMVASVVGGFEFSVTEVGGN